MRSATMALLAAPLLAACPGGPGGLEVRDAFLLGENGAVDVLFVVDDSNSMGAAQAGLAAAVPALLNALDTTGTDWQAGVVTTDLDGAARRGRIVGPVVRAADAGAAASLAAQVRPGIAGSQLERGLGAAFAAVTPPLLTHENAGLLREGTRLAVVVLSDEDDCSDDGALAGHEPADCASLPDRLVSIPDAVARLRDVVALPEDVALHALVETGLTAEGEGCGGTNAGTRYVDVARALGGLVLPHCSDGAALAAELGAQLADRRTAFPLSRRPDPLSLRVVVITESGAQTFADDPSREAGWTYEAASNTVRLWGGAVVDLGAEVAISYVVATDG